MVHKAYYPVITSIKHIPRRGPQIHAPNDILEIRRIIVFRNFWNFFPYPEEVIRIDRSKLNRQDHDVLLESYIDFGFKMELTRLYSNGFFLRRQLLNFEANKAFDQASKAIPILNDIFLFKGVKECQQIQRSAFQMQDAHGKQL